MGTAWYTAPGISAFKTTPHSSSRKEAFAERTVVVSRFEVSSEQRRSGRPPVRSYLLDEVARGLGKCDPRKVRIALVDSFTATLAMPENEEEDSQRTHRFASDDHRVDQATLEALASHFWF